MKRWAIAVIEWFEARLNLRETIWPVITHPVPRGVNWWYVFGSMTMTFFIVQIVTGICLALVYVPSADQAYETLLYLNYEAPLGWFIRALHFYSSSAMVVMIMIHMVQVFLWGAYKYPRELTWVAGVGLLFLTLGLAFTGQVLRWDGDAYWGSSIGAAVAGRMPFGPQMVEAMLGGPIIGASTLSRFFALHVFILPGLLIMVLTVHLYLVIKRGISEPPVPGKRVDPKTYDAEYEKELHQGEPFFPDAVFKDGVACALGVLVVVVLALVLGPYGPGEPPDPSILTSNPRPDWEFLCAFAGAALCPDELEDIAFKVGPVLIVLILLAVPFIDGKGERHFSRRPIAVSIVVVLVLGIGVLTWLGYKAPWSPDMTAWSGTPVPVAMLEGRTPRQLQGAAVLQVKNCRNCHALDGTGGHRGPDLAGVGARLTHDDLVRQVIQGGGNMPAYGKQLNPDEVEALVDFLASLYDKDQEPARPSYTVAGTP